jgi:hypothetical protein
MKTVTLLNFKNKPFHNSEYTGYLSLIISGRQVFLSDLHRKINLTALRVCFSDGNLGSWNKTTLIILKFGHLKGPSIQNPNFI